MRRISVCMVVILLISEVAFGAGFESSKRAGRYQVTLKIASHPLSVSDNKAIITVSDATGPVAGADLSLYYFMPSMPAMKYETRGVPRNNEYEAVIKPTMPGDWTVEVRVRGTNGSTHKAAFDFKAK